MRPLCVFLYRADNKALWNTKEESSFSDSGVSLRQNTDCTQRPVMLQVKSKALSQSLHQIIRKERKFRINTNHHRFSIHCIMGQQQKCFSSHAPKKLHEEISSRSVNYAFKLLYRWFLKRKKQLKLKHVDYLYFSPSSYGSFTFCMKRHKYLLLGLNLLHYPLPCVISFSPPNLAV